MEKVVGKRKSGRRSETISQILNVSQHYIVWHNFKLKNDTLTGGQEEKQLRDPE